MNRSNVITHRAAGSQSALLCIQCYFRHSYCNTCGTIIAILLSLLKEKWKSSQPKKCTWTESGHKAFLNTLAVYKSLKTGKIAWFGTEYFGQFSAILDLTIQNISPTLFFHPSAGSSLSELAILTMPNAKRVSSIIQTESIQNHFCPLSTWARLVSQRPESHQWSHQTTTAVSDDHVSSADTNLSLLDTFWFSCFLFYGSGRLGANTDDIIKASRRNYNLNPASKSWTRRERRSLEISQNWIKTRNPATASVTKIWTKCWN